MNKRKIILLAAALVMVAVLGIGGTLAYFTDDESAKNVMTVGKVEIDQTEEFNPDKEPLLPGQYIKKEVNVTNTGTVPAFIRTIFAFENTNPKNDNGKTGIASLMDIDSAMDITSFEGTVLGCLEVNGKIYSVGYVIYEDAIPANAEAGVSLKAIRLNANVTQEQYEAAGGKLDGTYEILVLSQASQTDPFTSPEEALNTAFGEIKPENATMIAKWLEEAASMEGIYTTNQQ